MERNYFICRITDLLILLVCLAKNHNCVYIRIPCIFPKVLNSIDYVIKNKGRDIDRRKRKCFDGGRT